ncbi:MAG: DUF3857 domain-containing protein [Bacteroidota bacterium]
MKKIALLFITLSIVQVLPAQQEGWEFILSNEFPKADSAFNQDLKADSSNQEALLGALFLADIFQNEKKFAILVEKLFEHTTREDLWETFHYDLEPERLLAKKNTTIPFYETELGQIFKNRHHFRKNREKYFKSYESLRATFDPLMQNQGWHFLGPFKNIIGENMEEPLGIEGSRELDLSQSYPNGYKEEVKWFQPAYYDPYLSIKPSDYLPISNNANAYFAYKRIKLEQAEEVIMTIGRNCPLKIWVDGKEVFNGRDPIDITLDGEAVSLQMSEGAHDILVKMAPFNGWKNSAREFNLRGTKPRRVGRSPGFTLRLLNQEKKSIAFTLAGKNDKSGKLISHKPLDYKTIKELWKRIENGEARMSDYYVLARYHLLKGTHRDIEEFFIGLAEKHPEATYFDLLLASVYERNGNRAMAYKSISQIDLEKTPYYPLLRKNLEEVDPKVDPDEYQLRLEKLKNISPSNMEVVRRYLRYYENRDDSTRLIAFKKETLKTYPSLDFIFEQFDITSSEEKKKKKKKYKYGKTIPNKKKIQNLEKLLEVTPFEAREYDRLAELYLEEKEYDLALEAVDNGLKVTPKSSSLIEQKGDIYKEKGDEDKALVAYQQAKKQSQKTGRGGNYYGNDLNQQIENITGETEKELWNNFASIELDSILAEKDSWKETYKDEDAVILLHHTNYWLHKDGSADIKRIFALTILNENGIDPWTEENFSYLGSNLSVEVIKPDGSRLKPEVRGTYAVFKNLEPGDIIYAEASYSYNNYKGEGSRYGFTDYFRIKGGMMFIHPIYRQKFELAAPEEQELKYMTFNTPVEPAIRSKDGYKYYNWDWTHTPKMIQEEAAYNKWAASPEIFVHSPQDWSIFSDWYKRLTYRKLEPNYYVQDLYKKLVKEGMTDQEKLVAFYNYITKEINYSSVSFLQSNFEPQEPQLTCSAGIGDCKDVATLMISLLQMAEIPSYFVLVEAARYVPYKYLPGNVFNHAIVAYEMDGELKFLDLTTDKYPYYVLPEQDHESWALLIKDGKQDLFRLPNDKLDPVKNSVTYQVNSHINEAGKIALDIEATFKGIEGGSIREYLGSSRGVNKSAYIQENLNLSFLPGNRILKQEMSSMDEIDAPFQLNMKLEADNYGEQLYGLYILPIPILERLDIKTEFLPTSRGTVMDLNKVLNLSPKDEKIIMTFPAGYELFVLPEKVELDNEFGTYELSFQKVEGGIEVHKKHSFKLSKIKPDEYAAFRDYYFKVSKLDAMKIVLVKEGFSYP